MYVPFLLLPILYSCGSQTLPCNKSLRELVKHRYLDPIPKVSDSGGVGWGLRICISNKFPGKTPATGSGTTLDSLAQNGLPTSPTPLPGNSQLVQSPPGFSLRDTWTQHPLAPGFSQHVVPSAPNTYNPSQFTGPALFNCSIVSLPPDLSSLGAMSFSLSPHTPILAKYLACRCSIGACLSNE